MPQTGHECCEEVEVVEGFEVLWGGEEWGEEGEENGLKENPISYKMSCDIINTDYQ